MKKVAKWIIHILTTFAVTFIIPFPALSDFVAEHSIWMNIGDGEEAYDNIDMITIVFQIAISAFIVYVAVKIIKSIVLTLRK
ncbi:hypothetical protein [Zymobacter sp. IVIA_12111.31 C1]|uniref:hypothetical protein n=1 Tax=Zymobacter sp. IVIA_12111.31 C1 TaxID=3394854 RepID=UPI0039C1432A